MELHKTGLLACVFTIVSTPSLWGDSGGGSRLEGLVSNVPKKALGMRPGIRAAGLDKGMKRMGRAR